MTDGISEARREERALTKLQDGLAHIVSAIEDVHDAAFGLPDWITTDINKALEPFGLKVNPAVRTETPKNESPETPSERAVRMTDRFRQAVRSAIAGHHSAGRAVVVWRDGQLTEIEPPQCTKEAEPDICPPGVLPPVAPPEVLAERLASAKKFESMVQGTADPVLNHWEIALDAIINETIAGLHPGIPALDSLRKIKDMAYEALQRPKGTGGVTFTSHGETVRVVGDSDLKACKRMINAAPRRAPSY